MLSIASIYAIPRTVITIKHIDHEQKKVYSYGYEDGKKKGYKEGYDEGYNEGHERGLEIGQKGYYTNAESSFEDLKKNCLALVKKTEKGFKQMYRGIAKTGKSMELRSIEV